MKVLTIDLENSPNVADVWSLFKTTVSLSQLRESSRVICFAAKWLDDPEVLFYSEFKDGHEAMVQEAFNLLDEADVLVHYNGTRFDVPKLNWEIVKQIGSPPAPFQQVDLLKVMKKKFGATSKKLDYVAQELGLAGKTQHEGHALWVKCMEGDEDAWARMEEYNKNDVVITEGVYKKFLPWIDGHPHRGLYSESEEACPNCNSSDLERRGFAFTSVSKFQRYRCKDCGRWSRSGRRVGSVEKR